MMVAADGVIIENKVRYFVGFHMPSSGCGWGVLVPCAVETWFTFFCLQDGMDEKWQDDVELLIHLL